jgi:hypothetical protein
MNKMGIFFSGDGVFHLLLLPRVGIIQHNVRHKPRSDKGKAGCAHT